ncbi:MAG: DUF2797 domain-containing protein [Candidatus Micrarchaeota archaeon]|nr:DUF2797 domain-containing protein [Candidatus Micrarchaeota archaeon]
MKHVLSFSSASDTPVLYLREHLEEGKLDLAPGSEQRFSFSPQRVCTGYKTDTSRHPCSNRAVHVKQCPACSFKDVARVYTVGDFSLYPHLHEQLDEEKYVLYLAQFGADITKLGLTRRSRVTDRWREQGADLAVAIMEFDGPDDAYPAESFIQNMHDVAGAVRGSQKIKRISFDQGKARAKLEAALASLRTDPKLESNWDESPILDLSPFYPQVSNPEIVDFVGGTVLGAKGGWLFYAGPSGQHYGVDMHEKTGKFLLPPPENEYAAATGETAAPLPASVLQRRL